MCERIERTVNDGNTGIIGDGTMREDTGTVIVDQRKGRTDGHVALIQDDSPFHGESESSVHSSIGGMVGKIHVKAQNHRAPQNLMLGATDFGTTQSRHLTPLELYILFLGMEYLEENFEEILNP